MGLIGDLKEGKDWWGKASFSGRCLIIIATFLAISSITSISDQIFQWRGFISTGLSFYHEFITEPILIVATKIGLGISKEYIDIYVLITLLFSSMYRRHVFDKPMMFKVLAFIFCAVIVAIIIIIMFIGNHYWEADQSSKMPIIYMLSFLTLTHPYGKKFSKEELIAYYVPIALSIFGVLILAAINHGLIRTV